ncbi:MAG: serine hydrolase [Prochloraceae cyanobacterium]
MAVRKTNKDRKRTSPDLSGSKIALFPVVRKPTTTLEIAKEEPQITEREIVPLPAENRSVKLNLPAPQFEPKSQPKKTKARATKAKTIPIKRKKKRPELPFWTKVCLYGIRLTIVGVGLGAIAGTILSSLDLTSSAPPLEAETPKIAATEETSLGKIPGLNLNRELTSLKHEAIAIASKHPQMQPRVFFFDLDDGSYVDIEANTATSAASTIKIPILVAFFQDVDAGKIALDEMLTMNKEAIAGGSGSMQYRKPGTQFSALETATKTIVISDNTATNMLIERMGGAEVLNKRFLSWGLKNTVINNPLADLKGTNTTSAFDLAYVLALVERGDLLSLRSRDRFFGIMRKTRTKTLLPQGLGKGAVIAHKTGDIGTILADAGLIDLPNGKRYLAAVMVKHPYTYQNENDARTIIQKISRTAYKHFEK